MARIIYKFKDRILNVYTLAQDKPITVGRHPANDIVIDNLAVSSHHARIENQGEGIAIVDLQSKNGTLLNGTPVHESPLQHKDVVLIGKHTLLIDLTDSIKEDELDDQVGSVGDPLQVFVEDPTMIMESPVAPKSHPKGKPAQSPTGPGYQGTDRLKVLSGGSGELTLSNQPVTIGRNSDADLVIGGLWGLLAGGPAATIRKQAGGVFLRYNGGLVKPKRNGARVKGTIKLNHEDIVDVGPVKMRVQLGNRSSN